MLELPRPNHQSASLMVPARTAQWLHSYRCCRQRRDREPVWAQHSSSGRNAVCVHYLTDPGLHRTPVCVTFSSPVAFSDWRRLETTGEKQSLPAGFSSSPVLQSLYRDGERSGENLPAAELEKGSFVVPICPFACNDEGSLAALG